MKTVVKFFATIIVFLVAVAISSAATQFFFGYYPALAMIAALLISSPFVFLMWRDRLSSN